MASSEATYGNVEPSSNCSSAELRISPTSKSGSAHTVRNVHITIQGALSDAERKGTVVRNVADSSTTSRDSRTMSKPPPSSEPPSSARTEDHQLPSASPSVALRGDEL